jgi:enamine deaminase RidA (YjgF/YER057c/UK114 family)
MADSPLDHRSGAPSARRARLAELGLTLHGPHLPHPPLLPVVVHNGIAHVSGQLPRIDGQIRCLGRLGETASLEVGIAAARVCALNALSVLELALPSKSSSILRLRLRG